VIKTLFLLGFLAINALAADPGFTALFDGKTLNGWRYVGPKSDSYFAEKGLLITANDARGNLFTEAEYANFVLRFDFKLTEGANNGIGIRAPFEGDAAYQGLEIQILDHDLPPCIKASCGRRNITARFTTFFPPKRAT
jgi:hypothetical protein